MTNNVRRCTACGRTLKLDAHHIAGAAYDPATTDVCVNGCHQFLSRRQLDNGVDLSRDTPKSNVEHDRARALGQNDLLTLSVRRRQPQLIPLTEIFDAVTSVGSALLDISADPDRPGRWLPDTIGARHRPPVRCPPVDFPEDAALAVVGQLLGAVASQGEAMLMDEPELAALRRLAEDPDALYLKLERNLSADESVQAAWDEVPLQMESFATKLLEFLVALHEAIRSDAEGEVPQLVAMAQELALVFRAVKTFCADAEAASTPAECRAVMLRLPEALKAIR